MIYSIFPKHTATVYERYPKMNTSRDEILELNKVVSSSEVAGTYNTKILLDFGFYENSASMASENIYPEAYILNLYAANVNTPDNSFSYEIGGVKDHWTAGLGRSTHNPKTEVGVSWANPSPGAFWTNSKPSFDGNESPVVVSNASLPKDDLRAGITAIVNSLDGEASHDTGLLIARQSAQETNGNKYGFVNFYSAETSTIYKPRLEIHYTDDTFVTGSLTALDLTKEYYVYQANNPGIYKIDSTPKFRFTGRAKYPTATYTASTAALVEYLPTSSYYSLVDVRTGETVVPFDTTYTKISCDTTGNFANLKLSGLYPERLYQFHIRIDHDGTKDYHILDDMFRVYE
jgi:hypothetical protein